MSSSLKQQTIVGTIWSSIERFSVQGIQFIILILMARILTPDDYGIVGMLSIFLAIAQSLIDSGFANALIQKSDRSEVDYSTVFYFNVVVGAVLYLVLFLCAPLIAGFYELPLLTTITQVIGIVIFINSFVVVPRAILTIRLDFRTQAKATITAAVLSGIVGIWSAHAGFGVWAIVIYTVAAAVCNTVLLWPMSKWMPRWVFSRDSFRTLFSFGSKLMLSGLIEVIYRNLYTLVIGKKFAAAELGYYTRADQFAQFPSSNLTGILLRVSYPILCTLQHDDKSLSLAFYKLLRLSAFIVFPMMIGMAVLATPLISTILSEEWVGAAPILQILCIAYLWAPVHGMNLVLMQVKGRSDLFLRIEIVKKIFGFFTLIATLPFGILTICSGMVAFYILSLGFNTYYTKKLIHMGFWTQCKALLPAMCYSGSMGLVVLGATMYIDNNLIKLIVGTVVGTVYYFSIAYFTHSNDLREIVHSSGILKLYEKLRS